jgi:hypothetical protein
MTVNCQVLKGKGKQKELELLFHNEKPDVVMGTESWLSQDYQDTVFPDDYLVWRRDRNDRGGGVFIAYKNDLILTEMPEYGNNCEFIMAKLQAVNSPTVYFGCMYRPPDNNPKPLEALADDLDKLTSSETLPVIILGGDFNFPSIDWSKDEIGPSPRYGKEVNEKMMDIYQNNCLQQLVDLPTHGDNILDLIFTTVPDAISNINMVPGLSKHDVVLADCDIKPKLCKKKSRKVYLYKKANNDQIKEDLQKFAEQFLSEQSSKAVVEEMWTSFKNVIFETLEKNVPSKTLKGKTDLPWITHKIQRMMKHRRKRYDKAKRTGKARHWEEYRSIQKAVKIEIKIAHDRYLLNLFDDTQEGCMKRFWSYIKSQRRDKTGVSPLEDDGILATTGKAKAEALSRQYQRVFTKEDVSSIPDKGPSPYPSMHNIIVQEAGVEKLLNSLNPRKASGPDKLPTKLIKEHASILAPVLTKIFQQSLDSGTVSQDWTKANVSAEFKKGKRSDPANYRPISLTSIMSKILEHIIFSSVMAHADKHHILADFQHGFRKGHSCETQLINTVEELSRGLNCKQQIDCLVLDFAKAFDTVPHQRLLYKLEYYGVRGNTLEWIESWITSRTQTVVVDGESSGEVHVASGVPQGTVMGPLLFLLFINDIGEDIDSSIKLFADDCVLFRRIKEKKDAESLQQDQDKVVD